MQQIILNILVRPFQGGWAALGRGDLGPAGCGHTELPTSQLPEAHGHSLPGRKDETKMSQVKRFELMFGNQVSMSRTKDLFHIRSQELQKMSQEAKTLP